ncbi:Protein of unknown function [Gryllus bimaculatus]|nr:Protein of unknown function [Gryllus bimaculatus]
MEKRGRHPAHQKTALEEGRKKNKAVAESTNVTCDASEQQEVGVEGDEGWLKPPQQKKKEAREEKRK